MRKPSFTLIEMLIVVVIIGILAAALIPRLQSVQARARDTKRKADIRQIATALEIYREDNGDYQKLANHGGMCDLTWQISNNVSDGTVVYINNILNNYMTSVPMDPTLQSPRRAIPSGCSSTPRVGYLLAVLPKHDTSASSTPRFDSFVLAARTESDGSSSNRVTNTANLDGNFITTGDSNGIRVGMVAFIFLDYFGGSQTYNDYECSTVTFTGGETTNDGQGKCQANQDNTDTRYIYIQ